MNSIVYINQLLGVISILLLFSSNCKGRNIDFHSYDFEGITLDGKEIKISNHAESRVVLNIYSPTCIPCVKEIPALNSIQEEFQKNGSGKLYIAVDPAVLDENPEGKSWAELYKNARSMMEKEKKSRKITVDILIMKPPFRVVPGNGLVTGTPETLIFRTKPVRLYYNFVGPITEEASLDLIQADSRMRFFYSILRG